MRERVRMIMKIGELTTCVGCPLAMYCDGPFSDACLCNVKMISGIEVDTYLEIASECEYLDNRESIIKYVMQVMEKRAVESLVGEISILQHCLAENLKNADNKAAQLEAIAEHISLMHKVENGLHEILLRRIAG